MLISKKETQFIAELDTELARLEKEINEYNTEFKRDFPEK